MRTLTRGVLSLVAVVALASPVGAEEVKTAISAIQILSLVSQPVAARAVAFDESLRDGALPPARSGPGEVAEDGTVRYGRATITVKNPCPPGTPHYEAPPLPGRRR